MLIFVQRIYLQRIRAGTKTATVRPWKTCTLQPGDPLVFSGGVRATITRVTPRRLNTLTDAEIRADGFPSRAAFRAAVRRLYPTLPPDAPCVVLHFTLRRS